MIQTPLSKGMTAKEVAAEIVGREEVASITGSYTVVKFDGDPIQTRDQLRASLVELLEWFKEHGR